MSNIYSYTDNVQTDKDNCAVTTTNILTPFGASDHPVIRVFINGYDLDARSGALQISVSPTNLQDTKLTIKLTFGKLTIIRRAAVSWIAFSPTTSEFASYGGQISQNKYEGTVSSDISSTIYQSQYTLYGLTLISILDAKTLSFTSDIDTDFILTVSSSRVIDSFSLVYVAVGVAPNRLCANCGS